MGLLKDSGKPKIKLVIWDLDETFWFGTLSEGSIEIPLDKIKLIKTLSDHGIVNSICSKNNFDDAKAQLEKNNVWDFFVFPQISWEPKGERIAHIIERMSLRSENVLFVDDNNGNLEEAKFYNAGLQVVHPDHLSELMTEVLLNGTIDHGSRLQQYKILEEKNRVKTLSGASNEEFLNASDIRVTVVELTKKNLPRVHELLQRTNQLNYTKKRSSVDELAGLIEDGSAKTGVVKVTDRFGDYGLCGFYCVKQGSLEHFSFSCRILGMGVENWCYQYLNKPLLQVVGDVANPPPFAQVNWINKGSNFNVGNTTTISRSTSLKVLLLGGCDLGQISDFVRPYFDVREEFNFIANGYNVRCDHTSLILANYGPAEKELLKHLPFINPDQTNMFSERYDVVVISPLMDFHQAQYRHKATGMIVPKDHWNSNLTKTDSLSEKEKDLYGEKFLRWFSKDFEYLGGISALEFEKNVKQIRSQLPEGCLLVFLTGTELDLSGPKDSDKDLPRYKEMNNALKKLKDLGVIQLVDVREIVKSEDDITDNRRHYARSCYFRIANSLKELLIEQFGIKELKENKSYINLFFSTVKRKFVNALFT